MTPALFFCSGSEPGAARPARVGTAYDDAATAEVMLNFFTRAVDCSALTAEAVEQTTDVTSDELKLGTFAAIAASRLGAGCR